ncbi:MAG: hypothetical protein ACYS0G_13520 [Planctomycetota bacterium]|jgi:hypothetical protein
MPSILAPIIGGLRRWTSTGHGGGRHEAPAIQARRVARRLAGAVDRAIAEGRWEHADRLAARAARLAPRHARLAESLARLRLAQDDPETALRIIDGCRTRPASLRLLRASCLLLLGARAEAHVDLHRWSGRASAPLDARVLLGLLEWQRGDDAAAVQTLQRNLRHLQDPRTLQALLLISVHRGRAPQAEMWAQRLRAACATGAADQGGPDVEILLASLGLPGARRDAEPTPDEINALALGLITCEPALGALVEAQRRRPHLPTVRLIRQALARALCDLSDAAAGFEAMARLSMMLGDEAAARHWAKRGLAENPMSVPLALLLGQTPEPPAEKEKAA